MTTDISESKWTMTCCQALQQIREGNSLAMDCRYSVTLELFETSYLES